MAAIGEITRFEDAKHLVGYAGLGARIHDSGLTTRTGKITKAGRKDMRAVLVEAAQVAANTHPHWRSELKRLEPRLGRNKSIVAIARKLLVAVWHVLSEQATDHFAEPDIVGRKLIKFAYEIEKKKKVIVPWVNLRHNLSVKDWMPAFGERSDKHPLGARRN
ncbi:MAG: IS110 family transposase [Nitrosomonas sp.]|nr:IS110 family transposase [Nitrosomonas sp.]